MNSARWARIRCALVFLGVACGGDTVAGPEPEPEIPCTRARRECAASIVIGTRLTLRYYRSHPLDRASAGVTRAVIVVHGTNRNADDYFATMIAATRAVDELETTVVLAPNFLTADDLPAADEAYWTSGGWKRGHLSLNSNEQVSSYTSNCQMLWNGSSSGSVPSLG
jgi:hypothetical protein